MLSLWAGAQNKQGELSALQKLQFAGNSFRGRMLQEGGRKEGCSKKEECSRKEAVRKDVPGRMFQEEGRKDVPERR